MASAVFTSYFPIEIYANESPHFSLHFCSPYCHNNMYNDSFVLRCIFNGAYQLLVLLLELLFIVIHFSRIFKFYFYFSLGNAV